MRSWLTRMLVGAVAVASAAGGPATAALASTHHHRHHARHHAVRAHKADPGENEAPDGTDNDAAAQAAACQAAGIDPNGPNVQYDDQTGTCTTDGGNSGQQQ